jgi:hypothetical protein
MYAATTNAARIETSMKKVFSSLTVPLGNIANNKEERLAIILNHGYGSKS